MGNSRNIFTLLSMKSALLSIFLVVLSFSATYSKDAALETVSKHGRLSVNGIHLVNQNGEPVQLKGMALFWSIWYPQFYNQATVDGVHKGCHSNVIRAALAVDTKDGGYLKDPAGQQALIEAVVEAAIKDDIYVIVDWHEESAFNHLAQAQDFFDKISRKYGGYPNIIYEPFNEPVNAAWSSVLKPYHEAIIKTIRKNDPNNVIVLGTPNYSQDVDQAAADPITDQKNIMYTLHFYSATHKQWLRDKAQIALDKGLPIFVTEYGVVAADAQGPIDEPESHIWWDFLDKYGISYVNYDISDKDEPCSALIPGTTAEQTCDEAHLTTGGKLAVSQNKK
nr:glycoside hydrolase family 5 subfamily 2 [Anisarthron barbipes]